MNAFEVTSNFIKIVALDMVYSHPG